MVEETATTEIENATSEDFLEELSIYVITYSQANLQLVPTREEFSRIILNSPGRESRKAAFYQN